MNSGHWRLLVQSAQEQGCSTSLPSLSANLSAQRMRGLTPQLSASLNLDSTIQLLRKIDTLGHWLDQLDLDLISVNRVCVGTSRQCGAERPFRNLAIHRHGTEKISVPSA